jgi:hypothetical protein
MQFRRISVATPRVHYLLFSVRALPLPWLIVVRLEFTSGCFKPCEGFLPGCLCFHVLYDKVDD